MTSGRKERHKREVKERRERYTSRNDGRRGKGH